MTALLQPYAGKETAAETSMQSAQERRLRKHWGLAKRAYAMFRTGRDTQQIASAMNQPEYLVLRWVRDMREQYRKLPDSHRGRRGVPFR